MDTYEATRIVLSRIQKLDPENASKIMGALLIQDHGEKEMIRLAYGPEAVVHSAVHKARKELGLVPNSPLTPRSPPFLPNGGQPFSLSRQNSSASRLLGGGAGTNLPSPLSIPNQSSLSTSWASSNLFSNFHSPDNFSPVISNGLSKLASSPMNSSASPFYGSGGADLVEEFQLFNDGSANLGPKSPNFFYPQHDLASSPSGTGSDAVNFTSYGGATNWEGAVNGLPHRRSCSVSDIYSGPFGSDDFACGFGWKPCLYYAKGYCKNGSTCRFVHGGATDLAALGGPEAMVGSPSKLEMMDEFQELLVRSKSAQQQRLAAANSQLMAASTFPYSALAANKSMNSLLHQQQTDSQRAAMALMMGEDSYKLGRARFDGNEFSASPVSRQIYLTFPADSTFREEDVSNYFSIYGPVQDVRIPYQQKRMFGFVTFVYPETVKLILAKGNPHFVCDARVLVKPYKEKGKVPDKYRRLQHYMERGDFSACGSPSDLDSSDPYDNQLGRRMFSDNQDIMWRRKMEEQAELQQAIELQGRKLMGLPLLDVKRHSHHRAFSTGAAIPSTVYSPNFFNQALLTPTDHSSPEVIEENGPNPVIAAPANGLTDQQLHQTAHLTEHEKEKEQEPSCIANGTENGSGKENPHQLVESDLSGSLEHNLPDSPFASPKAAGDLLTAFSNGTSEADLNAVVSATSANNNLISSTLDMASFKSCYFQVPRFSSGNGAIRM